MKSIPPTARAAAVLVTSVPVVFGCALQVIEQARVVADGHPATVDDVVGAAATLGVWAVLGWMALTIAVAAAAALPGAAGAAAARLSAAVTPKLIRRLVVFTVGVTVAGGAAPAFASSSSALASGPAAASTSTAAAQSGHRATAGGEAWPSLDRPGGETAVVAPGDCLWTIAAEHLEPDVTPAEIAAEWPRWYAANRDVIGPNPDLIRPGQHLTAPPSP